jgi:predicted SnoaL-like aldol condensation-catalyzing enzyme
MERTDFLKLALAAPLLLAADPVGASTVDREFAEFCGLFYRQKRVRAAFEKHVAEDYIQHSAGMAQGRAAAIATLEPMFGRETFQITPLRTLTDRDLALVILDVKVGDAVRAMVIDIYRRAGGKLVEHWDLKYEIPEAQRAGYFGGLQQGRGPT